MKIPSWTSLKEMLLVVIYVISKCGKKLVTPILVKPLRVTPLPTPITNSLRALNLAGNLPKAFANCPVETVNQNSNTAAKVRKLRGQEHPV